MSASSFLLSFFGLLIGERGQVEEGKTLGRSSLTFSVIE